MASVSSSSTMSIASSRSDESSQESTTETDEEVSELYEYTHKTLRGLTRGLKEALKEIKIVKTENAQLRERLAKLEFLNSHSSSQHSGTKTGGTVQDCLGADVSSYPWRRLLDVETTEPSVPIQEIPVENEHVNADTRKDVLDREIELKKIALKELKLTMEQDILKNEIEMKNRKVEMGSRKLAIAENKSKAEIKQLQDDQLLKQERMDKELELRKFEIRENKSLQLQLEGMRH